LGTAVQTVRPALREIRHVPLQIAGRVVSDHRGDVSERSVPAHQRVPRVRHLGQRHRVFLGQKLVDLENCGAGSVVLVRPFLAGNDRPQIVVNCQKPAIVRRKLVKTLQTITGNRTAAKCTQTLQKYDI